LVDLNENLTRSQEMLDPRPTLYHEILEKGIGAITTSYPDNSGWRSEALLDLDEVAVFGDDHSLRLASPLEYLRILGPEEIKIFNVDSSALAQVPQPSGES